MNTKALIAFEKWLSGLGPDWDNASWEEICARIKHDLNLNVSTGLFDTSREE